MGYQFSLKSANTIANLTFGKVPSCMKDIFDTSKSLNEFREFLSDIRYSIVSENREEFIEVAEKVKEVFKEDTVCLDDENAKSEYNWHNEMDEMTYERYIVTRYADQLVALDKLWKTIRQLPVKVLMLPKITKDYEHHEDFMTSVDTLRELDVNDMKIMDPFLILQPKENPHDLKIFDVFPNFEDALRQADIWPAVFVWTDTEYALVPVKNKGELEKVFETICKKGRYSISIFNECMIKRTDERYLIQLSDLHFGAGDVDSYGQSLLEELIERDLGPLCYTNKTDFIITGDAVDSPNSKTRNQSYKFNMNLPRMGSKDAIRIVGNHDVNKLGLAFSKMPQLLAHYIGGYPKVVAFDDVRVILLIFNSNTAGKLAQGMIGEQQMKDAKARLDKDEDRKDYFRIAVMHHHLERVDPPKNQGRSLLKKMVPEVILNDTLKLIDADQFRQWLKDNDVKLLLHGHKHIPFLKSTDELTIVGCGSSTGHITYNEKNKICLTYNVIKLTNQNITCTLYAAETSIIEPQKGNKTYITENAGIVIPRV